MRTLITLFLLAGTAAPAFSQASDIVAYDTISIAKHKSTGALVLGGAVQKTKYNPSGTVVSDTIPAAKYKPFNKIPADSLRKKTPQGPIRSFKYPPVDPFEKKRDSIMGFLNRLSKKPPPVNAMPNAISVQPFPSANTVYKGNNGEGFDIYESSLDRMPVLMPDSVNAGMLRLPKVVRKPKG